MILKTLTGPAPLGEKNHDTLLCAFLSPSVKACIGENRYLVWDMNVNEVNESLLLLMVLVCV